MRKKTMKVITSVLVSTIIVSNCLFVYASEPVLSNSEISKNIVHINRMNLSCLVSLTDEERLRKLLENLSEQNYEDKPDEDYVLSLLNIDNIKSYKQQLKDGNSLRSLLDEQQLSEEYDNTVFNNYKSILENAVAKNAITENEMLSLLQKQKQNMELLNLNLA